MSLEKVLLHIMKNYLSEKQKPMKDNSLSVFLRKDAVSIIENEVHKINKTDFIIEGSAGKGRWANIPWIGIFNKYLTKSAQKGIYVVFLFSQDMKEVYLSLNQGYKFYKDNNIEDKIEHFNEKIRETLSKKYNLESFFKKINLKSDGIRAKGYEACNIISCVYKYEELLQVNNNILRDLEQLLEIYDYLYSIMPKRNIDYFYKDILETTNSIEIKENQEKDYSFQVAPKEMIDYIHSYISCKGFIFEYEDIANFYLSLKTKPFVLLAGISGTGKSKLVELFANAIGANRQNGRFSMISVRPDWNDGSELFGYIDINGDFIPGVLSKIILEANNDLDKPYIVCLDEMNLARVEYYLSDYLSIIESRYRDKTGIKTSSVFPKGYFQYDNKYSNIYFSDNIYLVGTVNMDDTTFSFSEKVLDRANTIEFSKVYLDILDFNKKNLAPQNLDNSNFKTSYLTIKDSLEDNMDFVKMVNKEIINVHEILKKYNMHFGYRIRDEIIFYMLENNKTNLLSYEKALDYQIHQKILPRINGSENKIKSALLDLFNYLNPNNQVQDTPNYLDQISSDNSIYPKSSKKIIQMLRSYENGYVSFW